MDAARHGADTAANEPFKNADYKDFPGAATAQLRT